MEVRLQPLGRLSDTRIAGILDRGGRGERGRGRDEGSGGRGERGRGDDGGGRREREGRGEPEDRPRLSDPVDVGNLRIRAKPGYRAVVQELEDGQFLVSEVPDAPELGAVALAPVLARAAVKKLAQGATNLNLQDRLKDVIARVRQGRGGDAEAVLRLPGPVVVGCAGVDCGCAQ